MGFYEVDAKCGGTVIELEGMDSAHIA